MLWLGNFSAFLAPINYVHSNKMCDWMKSQSSLKIESAHIGDQECVHVERQVKLKVNFYLVIILCKSE